MKRITKLITIKKKTLCCQERLLKRFLKILLSNCNDDILYNRLIKIGDCMKFYFAF